VQRVREDRVAGTVLRDEVAQTIALRSRVLWVRPHAPIEPRAVAEEHVRGAAPLADQAKQVAGDLLGPQPARGAGRVRDPVLGLQSEDALHACASSRRKVRVELLPRSSRATSRADAGRSVRPIAVSPAVSASSSPSSARSVSPRVREMVSAPSPRATWPLSWEIEP